MTNRQPALRADFRGEYVPRAQWPGIVVNARGFRERAVGDIPFTFSWFELPEERTSAIERPFRVDVSRLRVLEPLGPERVAVTVDAIIRWVLSAIDPEHIGRPSIRAIDPRCEELLPIERFGSAVLSTTSR